MKLTKVMNSIKCEAGLREACRAIMFGAIQRLLGAAAAVEGITRSITILSEKFPDRAQRLRDSGRYQDAVARMDDAAKYAATVHGVVETRFRMEPEFEPQQQTLPGNDQLKQAAEFAGCSVEEVIQRQMTAAERKFQAHSMARDLASASFYAAESDEDTDVKASTVLSALERMRNTMLGWNMSMNTLAALGLLRDDIDLFTKAVDHEANQPTHTGCEGLEAEAAAAEERRQVEAEKRSTKRRQVEAEKRSTKRSKGIKKERAHA